MSDADEAFAPRRGRDAQRRSRRAALLQNDRSLAAYLDDFEPPLSPNSPPPLLVDDGNVEHSASWHFLQFMSNNNSTSSHEVTNDSGHPVADGHHDTGSADHSYNNGKYTSAPATEDGPRNSFKPINGHTSGTGNGSLGSGSSSSSGGGGGGSANANANANAGINTINSYPTNSFKPINGNMANSGTSNGTATKIPKLKPTNGNVGGNGSGNGSASHPFTAYPKPKEAHSFEPLNARGLLASAVRLSRKDH
ncbi:hypothetical protein CTA2_12309 [Colletotrichum tanaceti]|uniref:Uncharacterized protein n=1 Tax=Colletotrichum tanaceti TaxID=1306861 RepID=A0A4U6XDN6_9PEZI|nr:hypothetical protein CTA2_12309 [Colletotrichum tanaceti]TKW53891.1 hypothetical protein CTA1_9663 [Colletotrichum tanaceti]